jgi:phosphate transport system protein
MEHHFEVCLEDIRQKLLLMASRAESAVQQSMEALLHRNHDLAVQVKNDDDVIDRYEVEIDDLAIQHLTKAPLASDLRFVTVAMKISQNLERVGDEAAKIAKRARDLAAAAPLEIDLDLPRMATLAVAQVKEALDCFVRGDIATARDLIPRDKQVDACNKQIQKTLVQHMEEHPETVMSCLNWLAVAKSLERIADHAKNIAEEVVFLNAAQDIRHAHLV